MITVYFHGLLKQFGTEFKVDVKNPAEAVKAIATQVPGLEKVIRDGKWHVLRGKLEDQDDVGEDSLHLEFGEQREMHLMPAIEGSGSGTMQVILGVVLIVAGVFTFGATSAIGLAMIAGGAGLMVGGLVMMSMKPPKAQKAQEPVDQMASFLFNKPTNSSTQGVAIPRGYGRMRVGSVVVSTSLTSEELSNSPDGGSAEMAQEIANRAFKAFPLFN